MSQCSVLSSIAASYCMRSCFIMVIETSTAIKHRFDALFHEGAEMKCKLEALTRKIL
uniref:Uncharacterized protein n=1 Tax=Parascaris equorum TaxID=6256 RepID=A0A914S4I2_PAREQ